MMSSMETNAQIGDLVKQRQTQKVTLEHLKFMSSKIADAYSAFGHAQDRWCVDDSTEKGNAFLLFPRGDEHSHPQHLLGQAELAEHIREVRAAEQELAKAIAQLSGL